LLAVTFARVSVLVLANVQVHGIWLTDFELLASENNKPIKVVTGVVSIFQTQALRVYVEKKTEKAARFAAPFHCVRVCCGCVSVPGYL